MTDISSAPGSATAKINKNRDKSRGIEIIKSSPGSATLATTVQRGERVADADVPVRYHEEFIFY